VIIRPFPAVQYDGVNTERKVPVGVEDAGGRCTTKMIYQEQRAAMSSALVGRAHLDFDWGWLFGGHHLTDQQRTHVICEELGETHAVACDRWQPATCTSALSLPRVGGTRTSAPD
jgi:hypothetical protein